MKLFLQKNANFSSAGAPPPNPRAFGGLGHCPQTPIGLRRLGASPPHPKTTPPLRIPGYAPDRTVFFFCAVSETIFHDCIMLLFHHFKVFRYNSQVNQEKGQMGTMTSGSMEFRESIRGPMGFKGPIRRPVGFMGPIRGPMDFRGPIDMIVTNEFVGHQRPFFLFFFGDHVKIRKKLGHFAAKTFFLENTTKSGEN